MIDDPRPCDLCAAERLTRWHHEDDVCWIADCELCDVPMVVWKEHGTAPPAATIEHMTTLLERIGVAAFGECRIDTVRRNIPEHWHAHARPTGEAGKAWFFRRLK